MYAFLLNPTAGGGRAARVWTALESELRRRGLRYELLVGRDAHDAYALAQEAARSKDVDTIVAVGGDGTLSLAANALLNRSPLSAAGICEAIDVAVSTTSTAESRPALGLIPAGSGNDVSRTFQLPKNPIAALDRLLSAPGRAIDIGRLRLFGDIPAFENGIGRSQNADTPDERTVYFFGFAGVGIDAAVVDAVEALAFKKRFSRLAYALGVFRALSAFRPFRASIVLEDGVLGLDGVWLIIFANIPFFGGGMHIAPGAAVDDGFFDLITVSGLDRMGFLRAFPSVFRGRHVHHPAVTVRRGRRAVLTLDERGTFGQEAANGVLLGRPQAVGVGLERDGERETACTLIVDVMPKAVRFRA
ncbi:MAG: diacylglycerol kinase family lipid kinase [Hydrogenibacillus sp.]|nr:diacylglycerol kinase family lipid kinase [Hydrogenibacillus sp.]